MLQSSRTAALALTLFALAACGGGGGGSSVGGGNPGTANPAPPPTSSDGSWLTFDPAKPEVLVYEGQSQQFAITATSSKVFSQNANIGIIDTKGVITTDVSITAVNQLSYRANLRSAPGLSAGVHETSLEVRVCEDDPATCRKPFPGSPWRVPLKVNVKSKAEGASRVTLSGGPLQVETYPGEQVSLKFGGAMSADLANTTLVIADPSGLTTASTTTQYLSASSTFSVDVKTLAKLSQGEHSGNLEVRVCQDGPSCHQQVSGSPWLMPFKITVRPASTLSPLQQVPGVAAWSSFNGNAAHTAYVAATFDPAKFVRRWVLPYNATEGQDLSMANDNGKVFLVRNHNSPKLIAVNEATGEIAWQANLGEYASAPAVANGRVYIAPNMAFGSSGPSYLWVFDQQTGALVNKLAMDGTGFMSPTAAGRDLYIAGGNATGMRKYLGATDTLAWSSGSLPTGYGWTPAVDANFAYAYAEGKFTAVNVSTGAIGWQVSDPNHVPPNSGATATVAGNRAYVRFSGRLMAFDLAAHSLAWTQFSGGEGNVALANGVLYQATGNMLAAHSADTGALLWTVALSGRADESGFKRVIVTDNLAFVSSGMSTLAIDLKTHKTVWSSPFGGDLAISSNGVLYSLDGSGNLVAVNLR
jgi:outer membrane protein assembly factor BamB